MSSTSSPGCPSTGPSASQTTAVRALSRRSLADMEATLGVGAGVSSCAPRAPVPQLARYVLGVLPGRLDVRVGGHREPAGVHQHPAPAHATGRVVIALLLALLAEGRRSRHHRPGGA